ncbi:hypothetical protein EYF80_016730 [Liparis tanakae]|uniref:Uncharacterized protein n=1 Tax=Liparis tanakae TaxID=230148 RepID=A0A4Z2I5F9_9TELE|nr:hypothetical protein EYF80_016730 [Liparis tanakae]
MLYADRLPRNRIYCLDVALQRGDAANDANTCRSNSVYPKRKRRATSFPDQLRAQSDRPAERWPGVDQWGALTCTSVYE